MSKIEVNAVEPQCGTTLTIGASNTSIAGIGTVNWDTTAKTAAFTAVSGRGYFINTSSAAITVTLPASPSAGNIVAVKDYANTFNTNSLTVARNGSNIEGSASNFVSNNDSVSLTFVYVDATQGWKVINTGDKDDKDSPEYISATGGTVTTCGDFKVHTFTSPGTFCVTAGVGNLAVADYVVVAGGGAGGTGNNAGGGGAGGFRESHVIATSGCYTASPLASTTSLPFAIGAYPITVGAGGVAHPKCVTGDQRGGKGSNSVFSTITSTGGGGGAVGNGSNNGTPGTDDVGQPGGSGGGGAYKNYCSTTSSGGSGNTPPVSPPQGNNGGSSNSSSPAHGASGGGGAGAAGSNGSSSVAGNGGAGVSTSITGSSVTRAGGGGGGTNGPCATGGPGGGGDGAPSSTGSGGNGTANTGGGGGGGSCNTSSPGPSTVPRAQGGTGGSGIVIIRYKFQ